MILSQDDLRARGAELEARVSAACLRAGRDRRDVRVLVVTKTHPPEVLRLAYENGYIELGENYAQELAAKRTVLVDLPIKFRFIGHLQRNKISMVLGRDISVDTVDSVRLAEALSRAAVAAAIEIEVLLQVNVGGEAQKSGCTRAELPVLLASVRALAGLRCEGLMTMPPLDASPEQARPYFRELCELARLHGLRELSMGTSHDLEVAIEEGATIVRVGTALLGARG